MIESIIFLPFAGGSKYAYRAFARNMPGQTTPVFVELPGRGSRADEPFAQSLHALLEDIYGQVRPHLKGRYVLYGHSMGGFLGYLLTKHILRHEHIRPSLLAFTGSRPPSLCGDRMDNLHTAAPDSFWSRVTSYGGLPEEVLASQELREAIETTLRTDFRMIETYRHEPDSPPPIDIPILLINGDQENITEEEAGAWQLETRGEVVLKRFSGNHFFILGQEAKVLSEIFFYYKHFCK